MYDLNYTFLTELEVDTRQSFDDLSDDLLLLDKDAEESQIVDMKSIISSWQNYFWKSPNQNKQKLDITFTDISIEHAVELSTDWFGNPLNDLEMMTAGELEKFFDEISNWGGVTDRPRYWADLSNELCDAISALQDKYVNKDNVYPKHSILVTNEDPNGRGFGKWASYNNCYLSEMFSKANYDINPGYNQGSGKINEIGLEPKADGVPNHTHKLSYIPDSGSGGGSSNGVAGTPTWKWFHERRGLDPVDIGAPTSQTTATRRYKYSGKPYNNDWYWTTTVFRDANDSVGDDGGAGISFKVHTTKVDPVDKKIKVAPKTYPLSSAIWERTE